MSCREVQAGAAASPVGQHPRARYPAAALQSPADRDEVQKLSPDEAREYMKETAKRRKRELQSLLETLYGPDRAGARDR